jgi:hypothetical protein
MCTHPSAGALGAFLSELLLINWDCRFGHLHPAAIQNLAHSGAVISLELNPCDASKYSDLVCNACLAGKAHRAGPVSRSDVRLGRVFSDLLTLSSPSLSGCCYAIVFVDNHTRRLWTKPLAAKSDALQATQQWIVSVWLWGGVRAHRQ